MPGFPGLVDSPDLRPDEPNERPLRSPCRCRLPCNTSTPRNFAQEQILVRLLYAATTTPAPCPGGPLCRGGKSMPSYIARDGYRLARTQCTSEGPVPCSWMWHAPTDTSNPDCSPPPCFPAGQQPRTGEMLHDNSYGPPSHIHRDNRERVAQQQGFAPLRSCTNGLPRDSPAGHQSRHDMHSQDSTGPENSPCWPSRATRLIDGD